MIALTRKQRSHAIIHNAAAAAGGIGAGWISELWLIPDAIPLGILQIIMVVALLRVFGLRLVKSLLIAFVATFCVSMIGRGISAVLYAFFAEHEILINVLVAVFMTEALGWGLFLVGRGMARRTPSHSFIAHMLDASRHEPVRVLISSAPMVVSLIAAFVVLNVRHVAEVNLRAPQGTHPVQIDYPLVERNGGLLWISGQPRGQGGRVRMQVRNDVLVDQLERHVFRRSPPQVHVLAVVADLASDYTIDAAWQTEIRLGSNYWKLVRGRLYLLLLGLLGTWAMVWLGAHRTTEAPPQREPA